MPSNAPHIRIGTRGSALALWQAHHVRNLLRERGATVEIVVLKTRGDQIQNVSFDKMEGKGFFTKEIEKALLHNLPCTLWTRGLVRSPDADWTLYPSKMVSMNGAVMEKRTSLATCSGMARNLYSANGLNVDGQQCSLTNMATDVCAGVHCLCSCPCNAGSREQNYGPSCRC